MGKEIKLIFFVAVFAALNFYLASGQAVAHKASWNVKNSISKTTDQLQQTQEQLKQNQAQYQTNQQQINTTQNVLTQTQQEIAKKEKQINDLNSQINANRKLLEGYIQEISMDGQKDPLISFVSSHNSLNQFFENFDQMINVKEKILNIMNQIKQEKEDLSQTKDELASKESESQQYLATKQNQQARVVATIQTAKATISQLNAKLNTLRSRLAALLGEGVSMKDIKKAAKIASKATGVRADFILGELVVESDLGRFTGGCYYSKGSHPVKKHMRSADKSVFLDIMDNLGYGKNDKKLSCWPGYGYGGAMGISQFMPTTWEGYAKRISVATGDDPANPWNVTDGVTGMAIKLANGGANHKSGEHKASKIYYCGSSASPYWNSKCDDYADRVQYWADNYEQLMN